jgi:hypothetical protein
MPIDLTAAARVVPLTALMLAACVPQNAYEKQGAELQQTRAQGCGDRACGSQRQPASPDVE